jgi:hypothetical protein
MIFLKNDTMAEEIKVPLKKMLEDYIDKKLQLNKLQKELKDLKAEIISKL